LPLFLHELSAGTCRALCPEFFPIRERTTIKRPQSDIPGAISQVLQNENGILEVESYGFEGTQNIESNDAIRLSESEVADHHNPAERVAPFLEI